MKIAILTRDSNLYSCKRLCESAKKRGHKLNLIDPNLCYTVVNSNKLSSSLYYSNKKINHFDAIISRINPSNIYGMSILKFFSMSGRSYILNNYESIIQAKNKFFTMQLLSYRGIDVPITSFSSSFNNISTVINTVGIPLIIKLIDGTQGIGVMIANTKKSAISIIEAFHSINTSVLVQEYIKQKYDIRCLVIGNKVIGSIKRQAKKEDFRANLHRGGIAKFIQISDMERDIAVQSTHILGLNIAGVDIIRSSRGPLVIEVNASPGIEGIENTLKIDVADLIINFIEQNI